MMSDIVIANLSIYLYMTKKTREVFHNPEVVGSWLTPATLKIKELRQRNSFFHALREIHVKFRF